jgi:hypothetical protein
MGHKCLVCDNTGIVTLPREDGEVIGVGLYGPPKTRPCSCRAGSYGPSLSWEEFDKERELRARTKILVKMCDKFRYQDFNQSEADYQNLRYALVDVENLLGVK